MHEPDPNVPVLSEVVNVSTLPVGLVPVTVAVQVDCCPAVVAVHDKDMVVDVLPTVNAAEVPMPAVFFESPV